MTEPAPAENSSTSSDHTHAPGPLAVPPTPLRVSSDAELSGRGVTIAFLDAGFTAHPDLARSGRLVAFHSVEEPEAALSPARPPHPWEWHGTQTSVVAAGDGSLSDGVYRGLAYSARVVLVQVGLEGSIHEDEIARAFEWLLEHHGDLGVRVVNVSLGGDHEAPLEASRVNQLAEEAVRQGLVVVVAAGNAGCTSEHAPVPPASAPSVITVGGYHDWANEEGRSFALYCSSFGNTPDGVQKPDVLAPAMEVAAPILQGTPEYRAAEALTRLTTASDEELPGLAAEMRDRADLPEDIASMGPDGIREVVARKLQERKIVSAHYQHVDGTSFAAPIVASIVAQMLEANPDLDPAAVKEILIRTAERIEGAPAERQGHGVVDGGRAVAAARSLRRG
ncbi:MAG TPA: S8 family serine peptidase [Thermoanaerobaculia bacterium]|nr:S8 family serine peptidase [Thermoanaerobaculia bacterium]